MATTVRAADGSGVQHPADPQSLVEQHGGYVYGLPWHGSAGGRGRGRGAGGAPGRVEGAGGVRRPMSRGVNPPLGFRAHGKMVLGLTAAREKKVEECHTLWPEKDSESLKQWSHRAAC